MEQLAIPIVDLIEAQAIRVHHLAEHVRPLELDQLRDETAALQALIAEAHSAMRRSR